MQLIHPLRKNSREPALVAAHAEGNRWLGGDQVADAFVGKQGTHLLFVGALNDEGLVEFLMARLDILHSQPLRQAGENVPAVNTEPKAVLIDVGGAKARVVVRRLPRADCKTIE